MELFSKAFLCRLPAENLPRPIVYSVLSFPVQVTLCDSRKVGFLGKAAGVGGVSDWK